ncbi:SLATT domain-containing protein [Streptomyces bauhiniae]
MDQPDTQAGSPLGDPAGRSLPPGDWAEPAERLDELYRWVEQGALRTADRYLADRRRRRRASGALRGCTAAGAVAGAALPLLDATGAVSGCAPWGYLALLLAVACAGADRAFGLTSGLLRDTVAAEEVVRRLRTLQFDWAAECAREMLGPAEGTAAEAVERCLGILRRFSEDVADLVRTETTEWLLDTRAARPPLALHTTPRPRHDPPSPARPFTPHSGPRPNMPRQRPPEPR